MNHDAAVQLIPDFVMGWLAPPKRREIDLHMNRCEECRSLSDVYRTISVAYHDDINDGGAGNGHPTTEDLVDLAVGNSRFDDDKRRSLVSHVQNCAGCRMDFEAVQTAETELVAQPIPTYDESAPATESNRWLRPAAIAAGVVLAMLAYPAYLGLTELPVAQQQLKDLQATSPDIIGDSSTVPITVLQSPLRGLESTIPVIEIGFEPLIVLAIEPSALVDLEDETVIRFDLGSSAGAEVLLTRLSVGEIRQQVKHSGIVGLLVSTNALENGRYKVKVSTESNGALDPLFEAPFEIVKIP